MTTIESEVLDDFNEKHNAENQYSDKENELITRVESKGTLFGHPKGLYLLFFTEMWERFSYYGMRGILMLYMIKLWAENGLNIPESTASLVYGFFTGFVYFTPIIGGYIADKYLGQRKAITIGGITMMIGQFCLFLINSHFGLALGLILLIIGNGFFKPNISTLVGRLYREGDDRRDSAFSIFYMGINAGALIAPLICGTLAEEWFAVKGLDANGKEIILSYGFKYGFLAAAIGMGIGQIAFNLLAKKYLLEIGEKPAKEVKSDNVDETIMKKPLSTIEKQRIAVIVILTFFVIFFWAGFEQAGSSMTIYTDKYINRELFGWTIPTTYFQSVNPLFIVLLGPVFAWFWTSKFGRRLTTPVKMSLGMILLGIGFLFMYVATFSVDVTGTGDQEQILKKAALSWLVLTYFFHTIGELCLSPVGLSVVTKLAPVKLASMLMGVWMLSSFVANIIGGFIAAYVEKLGAGTIFVSIALFVIGLGVLMLVLSKKLSQMMHGVK
ncbi:MAG: peptide MFS transporter [Crocinitomicaceae bacterium]|nr:peptide MFS transporter [Crocinitomicaceae bacterium]NGF76899.1 peptide MFS transporter [Fluviicola sp. SGL-29]